MTSIQPGLLGALILGVLIVVIAVVVAVLALTGGVYGLAPRARRFIKKDQPLWWVRDILIAVLVAVLVLFGQSYLISASDAPEQGQAQGHDQDLRISDLQFVRDRSSTWYQDRPFRYFDLRDMNLAGLELKGVDFVGANLSGANLTGTVLRYQSGAPEAPGRAAIPAVNAYLQGANLCHAVLNGADLRNAYLINVNFTGVDLTFTRLQGAVLYGSDLSTATLPSDPSYLDGIHYDDSTIWPEGFQPPPSAIGDKLAFLNDPINNKLYGDVQRPTCNS